MVETMFKGGEIGMKDSGKIVHSGPTKEFFISMITRDIKLTDAIIELIDNSIDGLKRQKLDNYEGYYIDIQLGDFFKISDNCGGIDIDIARNYAFKFGRPKSKEHNNDKFETTGTFGIGMKRALFKMGTRFSIESTSLNSWFKLDIDVATWAQDDNNWDFQFTQYTEGMMNNKSECGTQITVTKLHDNIKINFKYTPYINELINQIRKRASYEINNNLAIRVNGVEIESDVIEIINDRIIRPYKHQFKANNINVIIIAGLAPETKPAEAGWYIYCNNREIVAADKTSLTTWKDRDDAESVKYHNDYASFRGFAFFNSSSPELLPWNTSKTGIDTSSAIYQAARQHMFDAFKTVTNELKKLASLDEEIRSEIQSFLSKSSSMPVNYYTALTHPKNTVFQFVDDYQYDIQKDPEVRISYSKPKSIVEALKNKLQVKSNKEVGIMTFDYFVEMEGLE